MGLAAPDAARRILAAVQPQPSLRVPLDDALDSVLAEEVVSAVQCLYDWRSAINRHSSCPVWCPVHIDDVRIERPQMGC